MVKHGYILSTVNQSNSRNVHVFMYIYVPSPCNLFQGLSLAVRLHDQFKASHRSTPTPQIRLVDCPRVLFQIGPA